MQTCRGRIKKVSIQLLFLFNVKAWIVNVHFHRFNTASVLIQLDTQVPKMTFESCFNTASVLIQQGVYCCVQSGFEFQYSFCSYSTKWKKKRRKILRRFQYSFCSYSTFDHHQADKEYRRFQYSFCSYSTLSYDQHPNITVCFNTASVLIQPLSNAEYPLSLSCFNTASVLIQPMLKTI